MLNKKSIGAFGENIACQYLIKRGYLIIGRNIRVGRGELDVVATKNGIVFFVEVKTISYGMVGSADEMLRHSQIKTLKKSLCAYCSLNKIPLAKTYLDFISVDLNRQKGTAKIKHYKNII